MLVRGPSVDSSPLNAKMPVSLAPYGCSSTRGLDKEEEMKTQDGMKAFALRNGFPGVPPRARVTCNSTGRKCIWKWDWQTRRPVRRQEIAPAGSRDCTIATLLTRDLAGRRSKKGSAGVFLQLLLVLSGS